MSRHLLFRFCVLVLVTRFGIASSAAQSSYRTFQAQHGGVRQPPSQSADAQSSGVKPHRFLGWKYAAKAGKDYQQHFQRPRAGLARPRVASNVSSEQLVRMARGRSSGPGSQSFPGLALRQTLPAGFIPDSVATGDFNRDGNTDWVVANGGDNDLWVYLGNGDGTASLPNILNLSGLGPVAVATADLRGDGKIDIIVTEPDSNSIEVFLGNGDGTFQPSSLYLLSGVPTYVVVADFNKDGRPDLAVAMLGTSPVAFLPGNGDGTFGAPVLDTWGGGQPELISLAVADINQDGNLDLVFVDLADGVGFVLGNGNGTFSSGTLIAQNLSEIGLQYFAAAVGDVNEDGCPDVVATDSFAFAEVYLGSCNGTFSAPSFHGAGDISVSVALQDVNGDGHLDIVAAGDYFGNVYGSGDDAGNLLSVLKGDGTGNFATASVFGGQPGMYSLGFIALRGASVPSVLAINQDTDVLTFFTNDGTGDFGPPRGRAIGYQGGTSNAPYGGFLVADVNGDNLPDLVNIDVPQYSPGTYQLSTILNQGNGLFAPPTLSPLNPDSLYAPADFALGDFRNTGHPDVVAVGQNPQFSFSAPFIAFAANQGNGTFAPATVVTPTTASGLIGDGDFNRDGKLDFVTLTGLTNGQQAFNVFLGNGDGTFAPQPSVAWGGTENRWPIEVYVGDFNGDGKLDVMVHLYENVVPYSVNDVYVFHGNGDGTFQQPVKLFSNLDPFTLVDLNHDGIPDIVTCRDPEDDYPQQTPAQISVRLGLSTGGFGPAITYGTYAGDSFLSDERGSLPGLYQAFCTVGDFNGDGNVDIGVTQSEAPYHVFPAYVQFLSGNGDGTFTPTYNIYSFDRPTVPQEFYDLNVDGKTDLLEMDGLTSSFNFIPGAAANQFQLETVTEPITGNTGSAQVSLNVPASSDTVITLQASDPGLQIPGTVTVPAGNVSQQFTYTVTSQANVHQVFGITATLGSGREEAYNFVLTDHRVQTGFNFVIEYPTQAVYPGLSSTDYQPSYSTQPNYETTLSLSCSGLPAGLTCNFQPPSTALIPNSFINGSMVVNAASNVAPGTYNFQATASDSNSAISLPAAITVLPPTPILNVTAPFRVSAIANVPVPIPFTIKNIGDEPAHNTVATLSYSPGQSNVLTLTALTSSSGTCSVASQSCSLGTVNPGDVITVTATEVPLIAGDLQVSLTTSDSDNSNHSGTGVDILAIDYALSLSTTSLTVQPGSQGGVTVTLDPQSEEGFNLPITLSCSGLPAGGTCTFSPATLTPGTSPANSVLTINVPQTGAAAPMPKTRLVRPLLALWLAPFGIVASIPPLRKRSSKWLLLTGLLVAIVLIFQACGGSGGSSSTNGGNTPPSSPTYDVAVTGNGSGDQHSSNLTLTVP